MIKDFYWANRAEFDHRSLIDNGKRSPRRGWVRHDATAGRRREPGPSSRPQPTNPAHSATRAAARLSPSQDEPKAHDPIGRKKVEWAPLSTAITSLPRYRGGSRLDGGRLSGIGGPILLDTGSWDGSVDLRWEPAPGQARATGVFGLKTQVERA